MDADGDLLENTVISNSISQDIDITDGNYIYIDYGVANATVVIAQAALTVDSASTSIAFDRLVLGYNINDVFYPSPALLQVFVAQLI
ncbi:unnamed protein product [marine sediment metagenome]|uniref:Uncharacterized protein n=1 Tax=marine sediment metagenome TaxID=412755 RepID=X1AUP1_9ZZZZ